MRPGCRSVAAWLALDVLCGVVGDRAAIDGAHLLDRATWALPGVVLAGVCVARFGSRDDLSGVPMAFGVASFGACEASQAGEVGLVAQLGASTVVSLGVVLRHVVRRGRFDEGRAALAALVALDVATLITASIVGIQAAWPAVSYLRLTCHGFLCIALLLRPSSV
jgi:hypothetical protein